jgi:hypothetical protein
VDTRACVFCGGRHLTHEDVIPKWVPKLLGIDGDVRHVRGGQTVRKDNKVAVRVRVVCPSCNHGWMSTLEGRMQKAFGPAVMGARPIMHREAQRLAATWAVKTTMLRILARPTAEQHYDPRAPLRDLYMRREPHPDWHVFMGRTDAEQQYIAWDRDMGLAHAEGQGSDMVMATMSIGYVMFHVIGWDVGDENAEVRAADRAMLTMPVAFRNHLVQIWPIVRDDVEVPVNYFTNAELDLLYGPAALA